MDSFTVGNLIICLLAGYNYCGVCCGQRITIMYSSACIFPLVYIRKNW